MPPASDEDRRLYLDLLREGCAAARVRCLAWCPMDNHVHLILVPDAAAGLRAALGEAHRRYTRAINFREALRPGSGGAASCFRGASPAIRWTTRT